MFVIFGFGPKVVVDHFAADEAFEWKGGEHVEAEAEAGDVDDNVA